MTHDEPVDGPQHQALRELLGSYALGHLSGPDADSIQAHLDGCASCRAEFDDIAPLADRLSALDRTSFAVPPIPPPGLGEAVRTAVAAERAANADDELATLRGERRRRRAARARLVLVVASVIALVGVGGALIGRGTAPEPPTVPMEQIALAPVAGTSVTITSSVLVNHTWGTELRIAATGFTAGETYRAAFLDGSGHWVPAGEFLGVGTASMTCNLQSAALRSDLTQVMVMDADGNPVARADLTA